MKSSKEIFEIIYPVRQELLDFCHAHKRIFLYGAGEWAERVYAYLVRELHCPVWSQQLHRKANSMDFLLCRL